MFDGQTVESVIFRGEPQNLMVEVCRSPTNQMFNRYPAVDSRMLGPFTWHMNETGGGETQDAKNGYEWDLHAFGRFFEVSPHKEQIYHDNTCSHGTVCFL